jgi:hypothetical protein
VLHGIIIPDLIEKKIRVGITNYEATHYAILQPPVTSCFLNPSIFLSILFSDNVAYAVLSNRPSFALIKQQVG